MCIVKLKVFARRPGATRLDGTVWWCGLALRLVVFGFSLCEVLGLLESIVVLLLLDSISDGLQCRLRRRHDRGCEVNVG